MEILQEKCYLLSIAQYRSSDLIVNLLSPTYGRMAALMYGGKKIGKASSFPYNLGDYIEIEFQIQERNEFIKIFSIYPVKLINIEHLPYDRFLFHCYLLEVIKWLSQPRNPAKELTHVLQFYLNREWSKKTKYRLICSLLWQLISQGGYAIHYSECVHCQKPTLRHKTSEETVFRKQQYSLDLGSGEIMCQNCITEKRGEITLTAAMIKILWALQHNSHEDFLSIDIPDQLLRMMIDHLHRYLKACFDINPKSADMFLDSLA